MLCKDKVTAVFCIIDDILKYYLIEDKRRKISDREVILTAVLELRVSTEIVVQPKNICLLSMLYIKIDSTEDLINWVEFSSKFLNLLLHISKKFVVRWNISLIRFLLKCVKIFVLIVRKSLKANRDVAIQQMNEQKLPSVILKNIPINYTCGYFERR